MVKFGEYEMNEVHITQLAAGHHYATRCEGFDDDGTSQLYNDFCWVDESVVPGQGQKKIRQVRFCRFPKVLALSQLAGVRFFGPIEWDSTELDKQEARISSNPMTAAFLKGL